MKLAVVIMASRQRTTYAEALYDKLSQQGFCHIQIIYDDGRGEWATGERCIRRAGMLDADYCLILQDDAIISKHLYENTISSLESLPSAGILSLYTGQVKPYRATVTIAIQKASEQKASYLRCKKLLWGVGVVLPVSAIERLLDALKHRTSLYDVRIGEASRHIELDIYYTVPSLVNHNDDLPSLINHQVSEKRVAWNYDEGLVSDWGGGVVEIF